MTQLAQKQQGAAATAALAEPVRSEVASQWRLMWWKFRRHKLAMASLAVVAAIYLVATFVEVVAPFGTETYNRRYVGAPPQALHLFDGWRFAPHVLGYTYERDPKTFKRTFAVDPAQKVPVGLFVRGEPYKLWGLIPGDRHLFGPVNPEDPFYLLGTDSIGRDVFSRMIYSTRVSMSVGLVGVFLSLILGLILGGLSGLLGGWVDNLIQRVIEILLSLPTIPLWLGLAAAVPLDWSPLQVYFMTTVLLSLIGWTWLARVVRGRFLALREEDFILAARLDGVSTLRLITRHMLPSFASHIIASITLAIPGMILAETSLSFLGLGLRPPVVSWGVMLQDAQKVSVLATMPWLLFPGVAVVISVLALNFLGDGLRDAADPYA